MAGLLVVAIAALGPARSQQQPKEYGVGGVDPIAPGTPQDFAVNVGDVVHFEVDSSSLTGEGQGIFRNQAVWLNQYPQYTDHLEGHADERGTREYNIALGARRATAVRGILLSRASRASASARSPMARSGRSRSATTSPAGRKNRRAQTILNNGAVASY